MRGPQKAPIKKQVTLRLDARIVDHFKANGKGWQIRMNEALAKAAGVPPDRKKESKAAR
jgi:uncharacterized protein (DUF4415 family)